MNYYFSLFDTDIIFDENAIEYYCYLKKFNLLSDSLKNEFTKASYIDPYSSFCFFEKSIKEYVNQIISELSEMGIYDITVDDCLNSNKGYSCILEILNAYLDNETTVTSKYNTIAEMELSEAVTQANSQIQGMGFGILSGSIADHMLYLIMSDATIREQKNKAQKLYDELSEKINNKKSTDILEDNKRYYTNNFLPKIFEAIDEFFFCLLSFYIQKLNEINKFNVKSLNKIDLDRSNSLLNNFEIVNNKEKLIANVISVCPFNINAYCIALENNIVNVDIINLINCFGMKKDITNILINKIDLDLTNKHITELYNVAEPVIQAISIINKTEKLNVSKTIFSSIDKSIIEKIVSIKNSLSQIDYLENELQNQNKQYDEFTELECKNVAEKAVNNVFNEDDLRCLILNIGFTDIFNELSLTLHKEINSYEELVLVMIDTFSCTYNKFVEIKKAEKEKEISNLNNKRKIKNFAIIIMIIVIVIAFCVIGVTYYNREAPYREIKNSIETKTLTYDMFRVQNTSSENDLELWKYIDDEKGYKIVTDKLSNYHQNNDITSAMWLLCQLPSDYIDGYKCYATDSFIDWIIDYAKENGTKVLKEDGGVEYSVDEFIISLDADYIDSWDKNTPNDYSASLGYNLNHNFKIFNNNGNYQIHVNRESATGNHAEKYFIIR